MSNDKKTRIVDDHRSLDYDATSAFFRTRGEKALENPLTATMYQDASLASRRDREEKDRVLPLLDCRKDDRVLDLGCGTGRWAELIAPQTDAYLGIDFAEDLLAVARERVPTATFQVRSVTRVGEEGLALSPPFSLIICSGILIYVNDDDVRSMFRALSKIAGPLCRIYLREPMAKERRLTLDRHWSDELQDHYSAIYRTRAEYLDLLGELEGFEISIEGEPFSANLQNRTDTEQRFMVLQRGRA
jgi:SAM-dependent methyltransferase